MANAAVLKTAALKGAYRFEACALRRLTLESPLVVVDSWTHDWTHNGPRMANGRAPRPFSSPRPTSSRCYYPQCHRWLPPARR